jgi:short-subunit dehydrogenase
VSSAEFAGRYGPWALVLGASDGIGAGFARAVASRGVGVVLVARREAALDDVAASISDAPTRVVAVDLTAAHAVEVITAATADLEVGTLFYCAGADPHYARFLSQPVEHAVAMVQRNCVVPIRLCHHYAGPMQQRGSGAIVLVTSAAGLVGSSNMVAYSATKAFDTVMAEALWAELHPKGVDVLGLVLGLTDTPALRQLLLQRGRISDPDAPIPGAASAEDVVACALAHLAHGPTCFAGEDARLGDEVFRGMSRNDAVRLMMQAGGGLMGSDDEVPA